MARQRTPKVCNRCGQTDLFWKLDGSSWRLSNADGRLHSCKDAKRGTPDTDIVASGKGQDENDGRFNPLPIPSAGQGEGEGQGDYKSEGQGQQGDSQSEAQGQGEGQQQGEGEQGSEGQQEGSEGQQGQGDSDSEPDYGQDVANKRVWKRVEEQAKWEIAKAVSEAQRKLDSRAARNEQVMSEAVNKHVQAKLAEIKGPAPEIVVTLPDGTRVGERIKGAHPQYPLLLKCVSLQKNVMLIGPAGTGKTTAAEQTAKALELNFYPMSVGAQTSKTDLLGYIDAHGKLVRSILREAYELGGLFLLDEVDAGNANVLTILNAALANGYCSFPDKVVTRHENFRLIAAANTFGNGADRQYVGRNQLDAATLDRFVKLTWDYDKKLEQKLGESQQAWSEYVWQLRVARDKTGVRAVFSTRAIINGTDLLNAGVDRKTVEEVVLWNGVNEDDKEKLLEVVTRP